jgi:hypothetical protein
VVEEERKDGVREGIEMGSGRRGKDKHRTCSRVESSCTVGVGDARVYGRAEVEERVGGQEAVACAGSQRVARADSARVCVTCIELEAVVCGWSRKGEEGEGSKEKEQGTRDEGRGRVSVARGCKASNEEAGRRRAEGRRGPVCAGCDSRSERVERPTDIALVNAG